MELDDLKQTWNTQTNDNTLNNDTLMQMIQHNSTGPLVGLKKAFSKQYRFIIIVAVFVLLQLTHGFTSINVIMFTFYAALCAGLAYFFYSNYRLVKRMEKMDMEMKTTIQQQISLLETRLQWHLTAVRIALLVFIALIEILPLFQHSRMIDKWHILPAYIRILVYAGLIALQYFASRSISRRKYGNYLAHLKELATQLQ